MSGGKPGGGIDHPVVFLLNMAMQAFMLLGVMPMLIWLVTSIFATPGYMKWVLDTEAEMNNAVFTFNFGMGDGRSFAFDQAVALTSQVLPGMHTMESPTDKGGVQTRARVRQDEGDMASSLHNNFNSWLEEAFVPTQRFYLPLLMVRGLVLVGATLALFLPFLAGSYRGQAERRRHLAKGTLLKPHRYMIYKSILLLVLTLFFAYPSYPVPIPAYIFLPIAAYLLHELGRKTSANMMEL